MKAPGGGSHGAGRWNIQGVSGRSEGKQAAIGLREEPAVGRGNRFRTTKDTKNAKKTWNEKKTRLLPWESELLVPLDFLVFQAEWF